MRFVGELRGYSDPSYRRSERRDYRGRIRRVTGGYVAAFIGIRICAVKDPKEAMISDEGSPSEQSIMFRSEGMANEGLKK